MKNGPGGGGSRRGNPLADYNVARAYVVEDRSEADALILARGADIGTFLAFTLKNLLDLEPWIKSRKNRQWLQQAGGSGASWARALNDRAAEQGAPAVPAGGFLKLVGDVLEHAQQVYVLSDRLAAHLDNAAVRELVDACRNELSMLAVFAARAAAAAGIEPPSATELAALSVWLGIEKDIAEMYDGDVARQVEEKNRRVDKFRKILAALPQTDAKVSELFALP